MPPFPVKIFRFEKDRDLPLPNYQTSGSAGMDLAAALGEPLSLSPGHRMLIPTGIALALAPGYEAQIRPRSGLALKHGITVLNAPATIDSDYRGELKVLLVNHGEAPFSIERGMRIAQLIIAPYTRVLWEEALHWDQAETERSAQGFGSTGMRDKEREGARNVTRAPQEERSRSKDPDQAA